MFRSSSTTVSHFSTDQDEILCFIQADATVEREYFQLRELFGILLTASRNLIIGLLLDVIEVISLELHCTLSFHIVCVSMTSLRHTGV